MKNLLLFLQSLLLIVATTQGQSLVPLVNLPVISQPNQVVNISFQQYLQQNFQVQAALAKWQNAGQNTGLTRSTGTSPGTAYTELAYRHDLWNSPLTGWNNIDSAHYTYSYNGLVTSLNSVMFSENNWTNFVTISYSYNDNGNEVTYLNQNWDASSGNWVNVSKQAYNYNTGNQCLSIVASNWNGSTDSWIKANKYNYGYDSTGNISGALFQTWDITSGAWVYSYNYAYTYNSNAQMLTLVNQIWTDSGAWANSGKTIYAYSANGLVTAKTSQICVAGNWVNYDMGTWGFDGNNNLIETASVIWDSPDSIWLNTAKFDYGYDANNNNTLEIDYTWNTANLQWDSSAYKSFAYNAGNYPLGETDAVFVANTLTYTTKYENTYNAGNNKTATNNYNWSKAGSTWASSTAVSYSYDENNNLAYQLNQTWNSSTADFQNTEQYYYYYSLDKETAITETPNNISATIYPNPSSSTQVNLRLSAQDNSEVTIIVYDALGRALSSSISQVVTGDNNIILSTSEMASGNYFVQLVNSTDGQKSVLKFIKM